MIFLVDVRGPALVRVRYDDDREPIMRDGPVLSCAGPAQEPASVGGAVTDCLPPAFADCLLDSALEPVLDAAVRRGRQAAKRRKSAGAAAEVAKALLAVTVCDPACGSGDLLVAAACRIARRVAQAREGSQSPDALRRALRDVVGNCVYGVDVSAEAVERTRDRLRRAAAVPGMPPPFLDARVRPGNALIGASPDRIEGGIPDEAFRAADGDDRGHARSLRRANARPDPGQATLFSVRGGYSHSNEALARSLATIAGAPGEAAAGDRRQAAEYRQWRDSADFRAKRLVADAWCAAFAWAKTPDAPPALVSRTLLDLREQGAEGVLPGSPWRRSAGCAMSTSSSTGTWSSPTSSGFPKARPGGEAASAASCPPRPGRRSTATATAPPSGSPPARERIPGARRAWPNRARRRCARTSSSPSG